MYRDEALAARRNLSLEDILAHVPTPTRKGTGIVRIGGKSVADLGEDGLLGGTGVNADRWQNAVAGNFGGTAQYHPRTAWDPSFGLGDYGYNFDNNGTPLDPADDHWVAWSVLNHNSNFAVVPAPPAMLGGAALLTMLGATAYLRRRRQA